MKNSYNMTIYVHKITMDSNTEYHLIHCERQCVRCKKLKNLVYFKRYYYYCKTSRYLVQYRTRVTCCECLDTMTEYNNKRKSELKR